MPRMISRASLLIPIIFLTACAQPMLVPLPVTIAGPAVVRGSNVGVDVQQDNGSVVVIADPSVTEARIEAEVEVHGYKSEAEIYALPHRTWVGAENAVEDGRSVLRVLTTTPEIEGVDMLVHLRIYMPECLGATVRNARGRVELRGVRGAISVNSGYSGVPGGHVEVRTSYPINDPVTLLTNNGNIAFQAGPGTSGAFDLATNRGRAIFTANAGEVTEGTPGWSTWTGVLNHGTNPVELRTTSGRVRVLIMENAGEYDPAYTQAN